MKDNAGHYSPEYDEARSDYEHHLSTHVKKNAERYLPTKNIRSLDLGCGASSVLHELSCGNLCVGLDIDPSKLKISRQIAGDYNLDINFLRSDAHSLPFKNDSFELVHCSNVLEHLENPKECFDEITRVLAVKGILILAVPNGRGISEIARQLFHVITRTNNDHQSRIGYFRIKRWLALQFQIHELKCGGILTGAIAYFIEGFVCRYFIHNRTVWQVRRKYESNGIFKLLSRIDVPISNRVPFLAFGWTITAKRK